MKKPKCEVVLQSTLLLREDQKKALKSLKNTRAKDVQFTAPINWGKGVLFVSFLMNNLPRGIKCTIAVSKYPYISNVLKEIQKYRTSDISIFLPKGRNKIRKVCGRATCRGCKKIRSGKWDFEETQFKGKAINAQYVKEHYSEYCPYIFLRKLSKHADIVITHYSMINYLPAQERWLFIDEVDEAMTPQESLLARYEIGSTVHLETSVEKGVIPRALKILEEMVKFPEVEPAYTFLNYVKTALVKSPIRWEEQRIKEQDNISYGLKTAWALIPDEVKRLNKLWNDENDICRRAFNSVRFKHTSKLSHKDRVFILKFCHVMGHLDEITYRHVLYSPETGKGYIEVRAVTKHSKIQDAIEKYEQRFYFTATPPPYPIEDAEFIEVTNDPYAENNLVVLLEDFKGFQSLIYGLRQKGYNILGWETSKKRAKRATITYGGEPFTLNDLSRLPKERGTLFWNYWDSTTSRALNDLGIFDGSITADWLDRSDALYPEKSVYYQNCGNKVMQTTGRVFRTLDGVHRTRFAVLRHEKAFLRLQELAPNWKYEIAKNVDEALLIISSHTKPVAPKFRMKLKLRKYAYKVKGHTYHRYVSGNVPSESPEEFTVEI